MDSTKNKTSIFLIRLQKWLNTILKYIVIGCFLMVPSLVKADYTVAQNGYVGTQYQAFTTGLGAYTGFIYVSTTTTSQADRIDVFACANGSPIGQTAFLDIYTLSSGIAHPVASSSLALSGNIQDCGSYSSTTLTFLFPYPLSWVPGVTMYFVFHVDNITPALRLLASPNPATASWRLYTSSTSSLPFITYESLVSNPNFRNGSAIIRALGTEPPRYYAGTTTSQIVCGTFDIGCYISQAFSFLLVPSISPSDRWAQTPSIGSTTPFSYLYQMNGYLTTLRNGTATNTSLIIPFNGEDLTIFNTADIESYVGGNTTNIKLVIGYMIWILALFVAYREVYSIFHKKQDDN